MPTNYGVKGQCPLWGFGGEAPKVLNFHPRKDSLLMKKLTGSIVALVTPFMEDGSVNYDKLNELIDYHIKNKTDCVSILGTTGESPTISHDEEEIIVAHVLKHANGRIPIMVGSGSNDTATAVKYSKKFEKMGASYLLVLTPYYNRTNDSGMTKHYLKIADAVNIGVMLYNVPARTGCAISINTIKTLAKHKNIIGIKEASGDFSYCMKVAKYISNDFSLYSGNDDIIMPLMAIGASGAVSVLANFMPWVVNKIIHSYLDGDHQTARNLQLQYLDLINALFVETNPIPLKYVMNKLGFNVGLYRLPLDNPDPHLQKTLDTLLAAHNIKEVKLQ